MTWNSPDPLEVVDAFCNLFMCSIPTLQSTPVIYSFQRVEKNILTHFSNPFQRGNTEGGKLEISPAYLNSFIQIHFLKCVIIRLNMTNLVCV